MRKIIWGIAVVFCVQVAFQLAMTANRSDADYAALRSPLQNGIYAPPDIAEMQDLDTDFAAADSNPIPERAEARTKFLIRYVPVYRTLRLPAAKSTAPTTAFRPVVITYDRSGALPKDPTAVASNRPRPRTEHPDDGRSLIAKVVTKPYDWLKAVGSTFH